MSPPSTPDMNRLGRSRPFLPAWPQRIERVFPVFLVSSLAIGSLLGCGSIQINSTDRGTGAQSQSFAYTSSSLANRLTPPQSTPVSNEFFGMTIFNLAAPGTTVSTSTPFPSFPISALRLWDVAYWANLEPSEGVFNWNKMDGIISAGQENGVSDFVFTFGHVPQWASTNPSDPCDDIGTGTCAPPDMSAFDAFAQQVVQRYCGKVRYYETWNEPNEAGFWDGSKSQLLTVAQHLYQIAKDPANCGCSSGACSPNGGANPNKVLMPPVCGLGSSPLEWLDSYLASSGARYPYADIATFHGYDTINPENVAQRLPSLRNVLEKHGLATLELWDTEANWGESDVPVTQTQASWLMRDQILQVASGISRFIWYAYDSCNWGTLWNPSFCSGVQNTVGQLNDPGRAYSTMRHWLIGATLTLCQSYQNGLWACELQRSGGYDAWMIWSSTGSEIPVPFPDGSRLTVYRDWRDNLNPLSPQLTVGQMPVLVEVKDL